MALVDFERAWHDLAVEVAERQGIGVPQLFALMKRLEARHALDESVIEQNLRRYGVLLGEDLRAAARGEARESQSAAHDPAGPGVRTTRAPRTSNPQHGGCSDEQPADDRGQQAA